MPSSAKKRVRASAQCPFVPLLKAQDCGQDSRAARWACATGEPQTCRQEGRFELISQPRLPLVLSLLKERLQTLPLLLVDVVHLVSKLRIGQVEVDFGTGCRAVPSVSADLIQVQTIVH